MDSIPADEPSLPKQSPPPTIHAQSYFERVTVEGDQIIADTVHITHFPAPPPAQSFSLLGSLWKWLVAFLGWEELITQKTRSWESYLMGAFRAVFGKFTVDGVLAGLIGIGLWLTAACFLYPVLQWPFADVATRQSAHLWYALGLWVVPLLVASATRAEEELWEPLPHAVWRRHWLFKYEGAFIGFMTLSSFPLATALVRYYVGWEPWGIRGVLALSLIPPLFSYTTARGCSMEKNYTLSHSQVGKRAARSWLVILLIIPVCMAWALYIAHDLLADRTLGLLLIGFSIFMIAFTSSKRASDPVRLLVVGVFYPLLMIVLVALFVDPALLPDSRDTLSLFLLAIGYVWTLVFLSVTLFIRGNANTDPLSLFVTLGWVVVWMGVTLLQRWVGVGFLVLSLVGWAVWGRKRWRAYLVFHESWWLALLLFSFSVAFSTRYPALQGGIAALYFFLFLFLIRWAYHKPSVVAPNSSPPSDEGGTPVSQVGI